ncbi:MAG: amidase [Actinomycetota bacterium]|nr:amidase [Actinomycetota bacterium]
MSGEELLARIRSHEPLHAFISIADEAGHGPGVAVKDLIDVEGFPTTGGGAVLPRLPAQTDATLVQRIRTAGGWIVGKTNLYEWAYGASSINPYFGDVANPRAPGRSAGGSSSGSAAAVAAGLCDWAVGTDTAGSIRIPASLCGVVGYKPTFGTVDTDRVIPLSRSLDTVGPLAPSVRVAAEAVAVMSGEARSEVAVTEPLRIAVPQDWITDLDEQTDRVWREVSKGLSPIALPDRSMMTATLGTIQMAEASAFHREWLSRWPERYSSDLQHKLERGLGISAVDYLQALDEQERFRLLVDIALTPWDALILPATAVVAPKLSGPELREPLLRFTRPFSLTGHPVIVIPAATTGLPVGIQIVGRHGRDQQLIAVASHLERIWGSDAVRDDDRV